MATGKASFLKLPGLHWAASCQGPSAQEVRGMTRLLTVQNSGGAWRWAGGDCSPRESLATAAEGSQDTRSLQARAPRRPWDVARPARAAHPPCARGGPCKAPSRPGPGTTSGRTCLVRTCPASSPARPRSADAARGDGVRARGGQEEEMSSTPRIPTSLLSSPRPGPSSAGAGAAGAVGRPGHQAALIGPKFLAPAGSFNPMPWNLQLWDEDELVATSTLLTISAVGRGF